MWHVCEEHHAKGSDWKSALLTYAKGLADRYPMDQEAIDKWYNVCKLQFPIYVDYWAKHRDMLARKPIFSEQTFRIPYRLPSGRTVYLRGKWDSVDLVERSLDNLGRKKQQVVYLQENKSKGDVDESQLQRQLTFDLQTMLYLTALYQAKVEWAEEGSKKFKMNGFRTGEDNKVHSFKLIGGEPAPIAGVRYNVIRRPLSGGKHTIGVTKRETVPQFYERLAGLIRTDPQWFFMRWNVDISLEDVARFRRTCLDPIMENLCLWYAVMAGNETPWQLPSWAIHWRMPYGVYNSLLEGTMGELDNAIDSGTTVGLRNIDNLFPELT